MTEFCKLSDATKNLDRIGAEIGMIVSKGSDTLRHDLVRSRRRLALAISEVFAAIDECKNLSPQDAALLRKQLSAYRQALASTQASHPASTVDGSEDFMRLHEAATQARRVLVATVRAIAAA